MEHEGHIRTLSGINVLAGIWLIISPFIFAFSGNLVAMWNDIIVGAIIGIIALVSASRPLRTSGLNWVNAVLGVWTLFAPFVIAFSTMAALWNNIIVGAIVAVLAVWSVNKAQRMGPQKPHVPASA